MNRVIALVTLGLSSLLTGCGQPQFVRALEFSRSEVLATDAQFRGIIVQDRRTADPRWDPHGGGAQVFCAEPAPDTARAFASSFGASLATQLSTVSPEALAAFSRATADAIAQLVRSNPVNILRDGLYRACEAYANGAITDEEYRILLSGLDEAVVAMALANEISGFAPVGPTIEAAGGGNTVQTAGLNALGTDALAIVAQELQVANTAVAQQQQHVDQLSRQAVVIEDDPFAFGIETSTELANAQVELERRQQELSRLRGTFEDSLEKITSAATTTRSSQIVSGESVPTISINAADRIAEIHRDYSQDISFDYLMVACMHALDIELSREPPTLLATRCGQLFDTDFILALAQLTSAARSPVSGRDDAAATPIAGRSATVQMLQEFLLSQGHDPGTIDGVFGRRTEGALRRYLDAQ